MGLLNGRYWKLNRTGRCSPTLNPYTEIVESRLNVKGERLIRNSEGSSPTPFGLNRCVFVGVGSFPERVTLVFFGDLHSTTRPQNTTHCK
jgi:hypothetical protein